MTGKPRRKSKSTNKLRGEPILGRTRSDDICIIAPVEYYSGYRYFQLKKKFPMTDALIQIILYSIVNYTFVWYTQ